MRIVESKAQAMVLVSSIEEEPLQRGVERFRPVGVAANIVLLEVRDEIEDIHAAILETVDRVLERLQPKHDRLSPALRQNASPMTGGTEALAVELEPLLRHRL